MNKTRDLPVSMSFELMASPASFRFFRSSWSFAAERPITAPPATAPRPAATVMVGSRRGPEKSPPPDALASPPPSSAPDCARSTFIDSVAPG